MKEVIYVHAGTSHIASHIFNAQQAYFTYDDCKNEGEVFIDHDISFCEHRAADGSQNYCPRLLLFDSKTNFGSLTNINAFATEYDQASDETWSGKVVEHRQNPIPQSVYHQRLDAGEDHAPVNSAEDLTQSVRFWSDYSRVFFNPRGLHRVPDLADWHREIGWAQGVERFTQYDADHSVMDDSLRRFTEECDLLQGIQTSLDAPSFGSFAVSFLSQLRDEHPKLPILNFCTLFPTDPSAVDLEDDSACVGVLNDALTLHELASLSTLTVPLRHPTSWQRGGRWYSHLAADLTNPYHSSAVLAAHLESATLPLRLKSSVAPSTNLATFSAHLNWRGDTPFVALSGAFPLPGPLEVGTYTHDFSHLPLLHRNYNEALPFAQRDILRGLYPDEKEIVQKLIDGATPPRLRAPLLSTSYIDAPYPLPSSHPQFFTHLDRTGRGVLAPARTHVTSVPTYTSLKVTPRTGAVAETYARLMHAVLTRKMSALYNIGVEKEMVDDAREGWWRWAGAYGLEDAMNEDDDRDEDEEDLE